MDESPHSIKENRPTTKTGDNLPNPSSSEGKLAVSHVFDAQLIHKPPVQRYIFVYIMRPGRNTLRYECYDIERLIVTKLD